MGADLASQSDENRQSFLSPVVLRQLQRRCGTLAPGMTEQVARLSAPWLEILKEALLEFRELADLEQWLMTQGRE
jgi:hypothetical protein